MPFLKSSVSCKRGKRANVREETKAAALANTGWATTLRGIFSLLSLLQKMWTESFILGETQM